MMEEKLGLTHVYCGDGKGKTTAAMGIVLRAVGHGLNVVIMQFLKDGQSGEIKALAQFKNVRVFANEENNKFSFAMSDTERVLCKQTHETCFEEVMRLCKSGGCHLLVLDEVMAAMKTRLFNEEILLDFLRNKPKSVEVVMTGREPSKAVVALADYVSEVKKVKHPYDQGVVARFGIDK